MQNICFYNKKKKKKEHLSGSTNIGQRPRRQRKVIYVPFIYKRQKTFTKDPDPEAKAELSLCYYNMNIILI